jgi:hypothetical protein
MTDGVGVGVARPVRRYFSTSIAKAGLMSFLRYHA